MEQSGGWQPVNFDTGLQRHAAAESLPLCAAGAPRLPLRVLIDARKILDGGIGTYLKNLIVGLSGRSDVSLSLLGDSATLLNLGFPSTIKIIHDRTKPYSLEELFGLGRRINRLAPDIFHSPHYVLPLGLHVKSVATVHDLIHITHPEHFFYPAVGRQLLSSTLRRADKIITVSQAVRSQLLSFAADLNFSPRCGTGISVIPNAVAPEFIATLDPAFNPEQGSRPSLSPYFLAVLSLSKPHKGIRELVQGYAQFVANSSGTVPRLVLSGAASRSAEVLELVRRSGVAGQIDCTGRVPLAELIIWYRFAAAVVVASRVEGFGLPVIEAKICGTPVVATPVPALKELLDERDVCCADFTPDALAQALFDFSARVPGVKCLPDANWRTRFSTAEVARETVAVYKALAQQTAVCALRGK